MARAGGSLVLQLLFLLLLAGELGGEGCVLQLQARQRVLDVHLAGSQVALEMPGCRGRGLKTQLGLVLEGRLGDAVDPPLLQQVGCVVFHAAAHELLLDQAVKDHPQHTA